MVGEGEATATGEATASGKAEDIVTKEPTVMEKEATATEEDIVTEEEAHVVNEDTIEFQERVPNVTDMERGESNVEDEGKVEGERRRKMLAGITIASILLGFIMLVVGSVLLAQYSIFLDFVTSRYTETAVFLLVMGIVIMVVSAVGDKFLLPIMPRSVRRPEVPLLPNDHLPGAHGSGGGHGGHRLGHLLRPEQRPVGTRGHAADAAEDPADLGGGRPLRGGPVQDVEPDPGGAAVLRAGGRPGLLAPLRPPRQA